MSSQLQSTFESLYVKLCGAENSVALLLAFVTLVAAQLCERVRRPPCSSAS